MKDKDSLFSDETSPALDAKILAAAQVELDKNRKQYQVSGRRQFWRWGLALSGTMAFAWLGFLTVRRQFFETFNELDVMALEFNPKEEEFNLLVDNDLDLNQDVDFLEELDILDQMEDEV